MRAYLIYSSFFLQRITSRGPHKLINKGQEYARYNIQLANTPICSNTTICIRSECKPHLCRHGPGKSVTLASHFGEEINTRVRIRNIHFGNENIEPFRKYYKVPIDTFCIYHYYIRSAEDLDTKTKSWGKKIKKDPGDASSLTQGYWTSVIDNSMHAMLPALKSRFSRLFTEVKSTDVSPKPECQ